MEFLPDGQHFVSAEWREDGARIWNIRTGNVESQLAINASAIAVSPDGRNVAVGTFLGRVLVWDVRDRREVSTWTIDGSVTALAFSPDGARLAVAQGPRWINSVKSEALDSYTVSVWKLEGGEPVDRVEGIISPVNSVVFVDEEKLLYSCWNRTLWLWSLPARSAIWRAGAERPRKYWGGYELLKWRAAISVNRQSVFWRDAVHNVIDGSRITALKILVGDRDVIDGFFFDNDRHLLTGDTAGDLTIWDARTGKRLWRRKASKNGAAVTALALSPDGKTFLTGCSNPIGGFVALQKKVPASDPYVRLWKLPDLSQLRPNGDAPIEEQPKREEKN